MKLSRKMFASALALAVCFQAFLNAEETREIKVIEDRDQVKMTSKIYELKNAFAVDITPFVIGAVKRYYSESSVERLVYKADNNRQFLVVNMPVSLVPYIDDMIAKLDRQGKVDSQGSVVKGTGIERFVYYPEHRASNDMTMIGPTVGSSDGAYFFDHTNNMFYWKDSKSDGETSMKWYEAFDRPVPQVELSLNIYEINDNDVKELGIDYISWKNGPGANIFNAGGDFLDFDYFNSISSGTQALDIASEVAHSWGGWMVAPQIDASFIRLLAQKGKAKITTTGAILLVNDYNHDPGKNAFSKAKYKIRYTPNYQDIQKDKDQNVSLAAVLSDLYFYLRKPTVNFDGENSSQAVNLQFGWELNITDSVEKIYNGTPVQNTHAMYSWLTLECGTEKIIASYAKDHEVSQYNGIPFLGDIPVLKYLFGATNSSKTTTRVFVTISAKPVTPSSELSEWAGKAVTVSEMLKTRKQ